MRCLCKNEWVAKTDFHELKYIKYHLGLCSESKLAWHKVSRHRQSDKQAETCSIRRSLFLKPIRISNCLPGLHEAGPILIDQLKVS